MPDQLTEPQWRQYAEEGYIVLGQIVSDEQIAGLQDRIDQIMLGKADLPYDKILMQMDSQSGRYGEAGPQSKGHKEASLNYRKIQDLELDALFLQYLQHPIFQDACARVYGRDTPVACMRAMFMNKPANRGTFLPWHQDRWRQFDRDPLLTAWTALDPATVENGCVQIIPGSHKRGLINPDHPSGFLTEAQAAEHAPAREVRYLELKPGEVALLHNHLLHASDVNRSGQSRRAFSVCYMDARTQISPPGETFHTVFGEGAITPGAVV